MEGGGGGGESGGRDGVMMGWWDRNRQTDNCWFSLWGASGQEQMNADTFY